jgi:hypothetical protein
MVGLINQPSEAYFVWIIHWTKLGSQITSKLGRGGVDYKFFFPVLKYSFASLSQK